MERSLATQVRKIYIIERAMDRLSQWQKSKLRNSTEGNILLLAEIFTRDHLDRSHCVSSNDNPDILSGKRAFAGVGLLWKASFGDLISPLPIDGDRIVGIQYACPKGDYLFFLAVYFPSSDHSMEEFRETLDLLWVICDSYFMQAVVTIMGDFNCHLGHLCGDCSTSNPDDRGKLIHDFLNQFNLFPVNLDDCCTGPVETFRRDDGKHSSTVNFIFIPQHFQIQLLRLVYLIGMLKIFQTIFQLRCVFPYQILDLSLDVF